MTRCCFTNSGYWIGISFAVSDFCLQVDFRAKKKLLEKRVEENVVLTTRS